MNFLSTFFFGNNDANVIIANNLSNLIVGWGGNDVINARAGNDIVFAGQGDDTIYGGAGRDSISGGTGDDLIFGGYGRDLLVGSFGNDFIDGGAGRDFIWGGADDDVLDGGSGRDRVYGQSGNDTLVLSSSDGSFGRDYYSGGRGIDTLILNVTGDEFNSQTLADELTAYLDHIDQNIISSGEFWGQSFIIDSLNLRVTGIENLRVFVDGIEVNPADAGPKEDIGNDPIAADDEFTANDMDELQGDVTVNDTFDAGTTVSLISSVDRGTLTLDASGNFSFDPEGAFADLANGEETTVSFSYELSGGGETAIATASITITGTNDAPTVSAPLVATALEGSNIISLDLLQGAADMDNGAVLSVDLGGQVLPAGVTLNAATLSINPQDAAYDSLPEGETMSVSLDYLVADEFGATTPQSVTLTITGTNDAPVVAAALTQPIGQNNNAIIINMLAGATDIDANSTLSVAGIDADTTLPLGVQIDGASLTFNPSSYMHLAAGTSEEITVDYLISDEFGATAEQSLTIIVRGENDAPSVNGTVSDQTAEADTAFNLNLDNALFTDIDQGDNLTITARLDDGAALPDWLSFDTETLSFSGTASNDDVGDITVVLTATDNSGAATTTSFDLSVQGDTANNGVVLVGDENANTLIGSDGNDTITGGQGNDGLFGGLGDDTYIFSMNDGNDFIDDQGSSEDVDTLIVNDYSADNLIILRDFGTGDITIIFDFENSVTVPGESSGTTSIETFIFTNDINDPTDDVVLSYADILALGGVVGGGPGDNQVQDTSAFDVMDTLI